MENKIVIDNKAIGQKIRKEREGLKLSREEFAEIIGISDYYIGQLERGERQMSLPVLVKIASCLHISLDYLILGKNYCDVHSLNETCSFYDSSNNTQDNEIDVLINKCSCKEKELFKKLIKTILPYISKN